MKYLISSVTLGRLLEADKERRLEIIKRILQLNYVLKTSDIDTLDDLIEINKNRRKNKISIKEKNR